MLWRRSRVIWTDPLPPPSQYVNVLGSKLRLLFRAPSGVNGSSVQTTSWTDEVRGMRCVRNAGAPALVADGSNFSGKPVVWNPSAVARFDSQSQQPPIAAANEPPEIFVVVRFAGFAGADRRILALSDAASIIRFAIGTDVNAIRYAIGPGGAPVNLDFAFTNTTNVHFISGRIEGGNAILHVDGADVASTALGATQSADRVFVGSSGSAFDGFVGLMGVVQGPMTTAERAEIQRIARQEFGF